jgi:hypothetical protein
MPMEKLNDGSWLHAARLPLGCGWSGLCTAPGHEDEAPSPDELREFCNLGYAAGCGRLPRERVWDSVRFGARALGGDAESGTRIQVRYVCEREHRPAAHGILEFNFALECWEQKHPDRRVQRMAECYLAAYLEKKKRQSITQLAAG